MTLHIHMLSGAYLKWQPDAYDRYDITEKGWLVVISSEGGWIGVYPMVNVDYYEVR